MFVFAVFRRLEPLWLCTAGSLVQFVGSSHLNAVGAVHHASISVVVGCPRRIVSRGLGCFPFMSRSMACKLVNAYKLESMILKDG